MPQGTEVPGGFSTSSAQKNDQEKDLVLLQQAHRQQQAMLRRCQEKVAKKKGLEEMVRQQEKVSCGARGWGEKGRLGGMRLFGEDGTLWPVPSLHEHYPVPGPQRLGRCDGHHSFALSWGQLCSLPQVIEAMERVLQEKLGRAGRSTEKPAGGCKRGQGPSGGTHT